MKDKKFDLKEFCKEHGVAIAYCATAIGFVGGLGLWLWHVGRNTVELEKLTIPHGNCYEHYQQFGEEVLSAGADLGGVPAFLQNLLDSNAFRATDTIDFVIMSVK